MAEIATHPSREYTSIPSLLVAGEWGKTVGLLKFYQGRLAALKAKQIDRHRQIRVLRYV
jgi:hypothetical protein